jgi:hypothetical protein
VLALSLTFETSASFAHSLSSVLGENRGVLQPFPVLLGHRGSSAVISVVLESYRESTTPNNRTEPILYVSFTAALLSSIADVGFALMVPYSIQWYFESI